MKRKLLLSIVVSLVTAVVLFAQPEIFSTDEGAIKGYDPVAFFKEHKPVKGKKEISFAWKEATWYFSSQENLKVFQSDPEKYAPQYGGYCAFGTAHGHKAPTQTDTWTIVNEKLYFNYDQNVKKDWNKDQKELIKKADKNWVELKKGN
jgi:YHS domain-containing protein